ncbi:membrane protein insertion efficiency factor YidD [Bacterioplanes sanyensis]|uniref:membrane protein insertion efficiency factor YidD n=1 Tax=Bacterioplanes sanyensis TaxID=1249553 RepID=UPI00167AAAE6|nr:membrane protein insertion efficiency factor YidD [Bacterioplanes sanyensis]
MANEHKVNANSDPSLGANCLLLLIRFYRVAISPLIPSRCRYYPTCSSYADEAVRRYGVVRGGSMAIKRILRCHPWASHGYDPVPDSHSPNCCQRKP